MLRWGDVRKQSTKLEEALAQINAPKTVSGRTKLDGVTHCSTSRTRCWDSYRQATCKPNVTDTDVLRELLDSAGVSTKSRRRNALRTRE